jgi:hypothetical protein
MATSAGHAMKVTWIVAAGYSPDKPIDSESLKKIGPIWGSHRTWRDYNTDNVVCHDLDRGRQLIVRAFQAVCNLYLPKKHFADLGRPLGVRLYDGDFDQPVDDIEDIISMHLASQNSDICLLVGFDLALPESIEDRYQAHVIKNRHGMIRSVIAATPNVQWAVIDHSGNLDKSYQKLPNLTRDTMENALKLLI